MVLLPALYLAITPAVYVVGDRLGVPEGLLIFWCFPYDYLQEGSLIWRPLNDYWMLWMQIGYGR
jgi:hypothetical protein